MTKAQWRSDPNCPPESESQSKKWFERLTSDTEAHLITLLRESEEGRAAAHVAEDVQARTEQTNHATFSKLTELRQTGSKLDAVACQRGCNYCCHLEVGCYPPEAIRIADHLRKTRDAKQLSALVAKMRRHSKRKESLTDKQRSSANVGPCPFLGSSGECTIYEVRPISCRTYHTFSLKECERAFHNPDRKLNVTMVSEPLDTRDALFLALQNACEKFNLPVNEIELVRGVLVALKNSQASTQWRRGADVFAEANT